MYSVNHPRCFPYVKHSQEIVSQRHDITLQCQVEFHQELRVCNAFASEVAFDVARGPGDSQMAG
jgi:hypothetical protein